MSSADASTAAIAVATTAAIAAAVDGAPSIMAAMAPSNNAGAIARRAVSIGGRGAHVASRPIAHASQSKHSAAMRDALDQLSTLAAAAEPAVSGSDTHATRSSQS